MLTKMIRDEVPAFSMHHMPLDRFFHLREKSRKKELKKSHFGIPFVQNDIFRHFGALQRTALIQGQAATAVTIIVDDWSKFLSIFLVILGPTFH